MHHVNALCLMVDLMRKHGLGHWRIRWTRSKREFGRCDWYRQTLHLSMPLTEANDEMEVKDTILHEIAHALTPHDRGHGWEWKKKCIEIGAKPKRCFTWDEVRRAD